MKFTIYAASCLEHPDYPKYGLKVKYLDKLAVAGFKVSNDECFSIEIESLEELVRLMDEVGELIISPCLTNPQITIYDDYIE